MKHAINTWDFHFHSNLSDGAHSPEELAEFCVAAGISAAALTDHDTTAGIERFRAAAGDRFQVISGIELSSRWQRQNIHVVGLGFDVTHSAILEMIDLQTSLRNERNAKIANRLNKLVGGDHDILAMAQELSGEGQLCRPHFAQVVVNLGLANDTGRVFDRWLGNGKPAAASIEWPDISAVVEAISAAGGFAVIAHPMHYKMTRSKLESLMADFAECGGQAIEVATPDLQLNGVQSLIDRAAKYGLIASGGSDFHNSSWGGRGVGRFPQLPENTASVVSALVAGEAL
ncbi:MAG: PHP domain-containing protein [Pseudomonadales bacterium]|jgi:predicted metal-dependent phosphoesterase TrpH